MKIYEDSPYYAGKNQMVILELDTGEVTTGIITDSNVDTLTIDDKLLIYRSKIVSLFIIQTELAAIASCFGISEKDLSDKFYDHGLEIRKRA